MEKIHNTYPYEELDVETTEIRIVELLPGTREDPVKCKLLRYSLNDPPEYDAVSYTWGDTTSLSNIQVGSHTEFIVPKNTKSALTDVRLTDKSRFLWMDSICINQQNVAERNHQVTQMRYIYSCASTVRIWLDYPVDLQSPAFVKLASLDDQSTHEQLGDESKFWYAVTEIGVQNYWKRVWVQQELYLARCVALHCRQNIVSINSLVLSNKLIDERFDSFEGRPLKEMMKAMLPWSRVPCFSIKDYNFISLDDSQSAEAQKASEQHFGHILEAVVTFRAYGSSDPRDNIFACLGLLEESVDEDIEVDYNLSVEGNYLKLVRVLIEKFHSLVFLCHAAGDACSDTQLPSWVPDWRVDYAPMLVSAQRHRKLKNATGTVSGGLPYMMDNCSKLRVSGFRIDCLAQIFTKMPWKDDVTREEGFSTLFEVLEELHEMRNPKPTDCLRSRLADKLRKQKWNRSGLRALLETLALYGVLKNDSLDMMFNTTYAFLRGEISNPRRRKRNEQKWLEAWTSEKTPDPMFQDTWSAHIEVVKHTTRHQNLFITKNARVGSGPVCANPGDEIWILFRCPTPMVLRRQGDEYTVQGAAYVSGCMQEEPMNDMPEIVEVGQKFGEYLIEEITLC